MAWGKKAKKPSTPDEIARRKHDQLVREGVARDAEKRREKDPTRWGLQDDAVVLAAERGEEITAFPAAPGEREKPPKRLSGLDWLWFKNRITVTQMGAGLKYGDLYRRANDVSIRSGANMSIGGGDGLKTLEKRTEAAQLIGQVRADGLRGHTDLIWLCDEICGEGRRIRDLSAGDDAEATKKEARFTVALDLLATHYGMVSR